MAPACYINIQNIIFFFPLGFLSVLENLPTVLSKLDGCPVIVKVIVLFLV